MSALLCCSKFETIPSADLLILLNIGCELLFADEPHTAQCLTHGFVLDIFFFLTFSLQFSDPICLPALPTFSGRPEGLDDNVLLLYLLYLV